jgi:hypothetical protein
MPALIRPGTVKVVTNEGEVQMLITLELNINLNTSGMIENVEAKAKVEPKKEESIWEIPDFGTQKIDFGKRE